MRRFLVPLTLAAALVAPATAAALPKVLTQGKPAFEVKPASIGYTGDGTGVIGGTDGRDARHPGHLRWTAYGAKEGRARGAVFINDCEPSCAGGTFHRVSAQVRVSVPKHGRFTHLRLTYRYRGKRYVDRRVIHHYGSYWAYAIAG